MKKALFGVLVLSLLSVAVANQQGQVTFNIEVPGQAALAVDGGGTASVGFGTGFSQDFIQDGGVNFTLRYVNNKTVEPEGEPGTFLAPGAIGVVLSTDGDQLLDGLTLDISEQSGPACGNSVAQVNSGGNLANPGGLGGVWNNLRNAGSGSFDSVELVVGGTMEADFVGPFEVLDDADSNTEASESSFVNAAADSIKGFACGVDANTGQGYDVAISTQGDSLLAEGSLVDRGLVTVILSARM